MLFLSDSGSWIVIVLMTPSQSVSGIHEETGPWRRLAPSRENPSRYALLYDDIQPQMQVPAPCRHRHRAGTGATRNEFPANRTGRRGTAQSPGHLRGAPPAGELPGPAKHPCTPSHNPHKTADE